MEEVNKAWQCLATWAALGQLCLVAQEWAAVSTPAQARLFCFQSVLSVSWLPHFPSLHTRHQQVKMDPFVRK